MAEPLIIQCMAAEKIDKGDLCFVKNEKLYRVKPINRFWAFFRFRRKRFNRQQFKGEAVYDATKDSWAYMYIK